MIVTTTHPAADVASESLLEASAWARETFFGGRGPIEPDELHESPQPRTLHDTVAGAPRCRVWLSLLERSAFTQLADSAAHESFHVAAGANVYHWSHEVLAELTAQLSHARCDTDPHGPRRSKGDWRIGQARLSSRFLSVQQMREHPVPSRDPQTFLFFYARARVVGCALHEAVGTNALGELAVSVRESACPDLPHLFHEGCAMDDAVAQWIDELPVRQARVVREVLRLDAPAGRV